ncbi:hypothetical protein A2715_04825 [Candidatus Woesebacteria bacterium RIFCSPHIGHO2_01_FULL_39_32]|uniref:Uncharacterized protein n=1 Tax=Candidatus Woesebacteria bacterium RIFCSPLOWO2_01_FULL_39_25 TaxID=1802521 RepID=A0A1F8BLF6_9BACT|nr:MAG: hypothetical protein A2715_04825 [Candidatus Woesebacteria bacterium RIFCSPHIGHO2_01_FULL_39_32]OGM37841.1 MAG: hypothetical protein A3F01_02035 [Candidatus Woesebacteria bacterium RIFCSPHIGHO2_12_FULL_38_11]OGM64873.1 MAG: hypothetical protein A2893_04435 [Candidatus Woesebacteria bacterium RIFCSPLOWO2_01_FULL_39_25]
MKKVTATKIVKTVEKLKRDGKKWHFHLLTPGCVFNEEKMFALILESSTDGDHLVHHSLKKPADAGKKLVELLHGKDISKKKSKKSSKKLSAKVTMMIERAIQLNNKGFAWHHHLLFPDCIFNHDTRYWTLVFEDPLNGKVIKDMSKEEPKEALKKIEPLFYAQKK